MTIATDTLNLEVIYGDTDSVMINTHIPSTADNANASLALYKQVLTLGNKVKLNVNQLYKTLELEVDGVFQTMLLLKKKKYAAVTVSQNGNQLVYNKELKGLDLVRRDWCVASKECGRYVLDRILDSSKTGSESAVLEIEDYLSNLAQSMREGTLSLQKYVITKGLSKHPRDYPDANAQPHVWVARRMLQMQQPVNVGDHIPYIICCPPEEEGKGDESTTAAVKHVKKSAGQHAHHPDEIERSNGVLKPDIEWYLKQQILPPISRLCEPIEGVDQRSIATKLGLDLNSMHFTTNFNEDDMEERLVDYVPASALKDEERFKNCEPLKVLCAKCGERSTFQGCFTLIQDDDKEENLSYRGFICGNDSCRSPYFGETNRVSCFGRISSAIVEHSRKWVREHYKCALKCDDITCGFTSHMPSLIGSEGHFCPVSGCRGILRQTYPATKLYTQKEPKI